MKKIKLILCFSLFTLGSSLFAQSWEWGGAGYGAIKSGLNGNTIATDKNGNVYLTGGYATSLTFGTYTLTATFGNLYLAKFNSSGVIQWALQPGFNNSTKDQ